MPRTPKTDSALREALLGSLAIARDQSDGGQSLTMLGYYLKTQHQYSGIFTPDDASVLYSMQDMGSPADVTGFWMLLGINDAGSAWLNAVRADRGPLTAQQLRLSSRMDPSLIWLIRAIYGSTERSAKEVESWLDDQAAMRQLSRSDRESATVDVNVASALYVAQKAWGLSDARTLRLLQSALQRRCVYAQDLPLVLTSEEQAAAQQNFDAASSAADRLSMGGYLVRRSQAWKENSNILTELKRVLSDSDSRDWRWGAVVLDYPLEVPNNILVDVDPAWDIGGEKWDYRTDLRVAVASRILTWNGKKKQAEDLLLRQVELWSKSFGVGYPFCPISAIELIVAHKNTAVIKLLSTVKAPGSAPGLEFLYWVM